MDNSVIDKDKSDWRVFKEGLISWVSMQSETLTMKIDEEEGVRMI